MKTLSKEDFEFLKTINDGADYHFIDGLHYKAGRYGLSVHRLSGKGELKMIGHCNDFRNKSHNEVVAALKIKIN